MRVIHTDLPDVLVFQPQVFTDDRGFLMETFRESWLPDVEFVQDNHSRSISRTLRGLHYQLANPQGKLVRVIQGSVFDVAIDIRQSSDTFGHWTSRILSHENREIFWIPEGFAHGFVVLSSTAEFVYKCTDYYAPDDQFGIRWDDPDLAIGWPKESLPPILSQKDAAAPLFRDAEVYD